ncbi:1714_t:CDS:2 [Racocetra fulgida]|uniref:1714_t:CDS:1 n=1 Tax=Racocetra fulgida TaxID=60492 RepID=A0A9N9B711_9GLOM|nr:1714_t:CDS:2 [Racocetra fulgida]
MFPLRTRFKKNTYQQTYNLHIRSKKTYLSDYTFSDDLNHNRFETSHYDNQQSKQELSNSLDNDDQQFEPNDDQQSYHENIDQDHSDQDHIDQNHIDQDQYHSDQYYSDQDHIDQDYNDQDYSDTDHSNQDYNDWNNLYDTGNIESDQEFDDLSYGDLESVDNEIR